MALSKGDKSHPPAPQKITISGLINLYNEWLQHHIQSGLDLLINTTLYVLTYSFKLW